MNIDFGEYNNLILNTIATGVITLIATLVAGIITAIVSYFLNKRYTDKLEMQRLENEKELTKIRKENSMELEKMRAELKINASIEENSLKMAQEFNLHSSFIISSYKKTEDEEEDFNFNKLKNDKEGRELISRFNMFFTTFDFMFELYKKGKINDFCFKYCDESLSGYMKEKFYQQAFEYFIKVDNYTDETIKYIKMKY